MTVRSGGVPTIKLTTLTGEPCLISFEPWGTEHVLMPGDVVYVESVAFATGDVEVSGADLKLWDGWPS